MKENIFKVDSVKKFWVNVCAYIIAFGLMISTGGAWVSDAKLTLEQEDIIFRILVITILISMILFVINSSKQYSISISVKQNIILFVLCCLTYLYKFQGDFQAYFWWFCIPILWFIFFLVQIDDINIVWRAFTNIVTIFALISLFYYFFGTCIKLIPETGITEIYWGTWDTSAIRTFYNLYYEAQFIKTNGTHVIARNCGIFSEAPMYNFVLCTAVASEIFLSNKKQWWKVIILSITIITTLSTTGYLFLIITILLYLANIIFSDKGMNIHKIAFITLTILGILMMGGILIHKMMTISGLGSMNVRNDHLIACIKAWMDSPVLGVGYENQEAIMQYEKYQQGMSVGITYLLATGGILLSSLILIPYFITMKNSLKERKFDTCIFETLFLILYFFTAITGYPILRFFIAYILVFQHNREKNIQKKDAMKSIIVKNLNSVECTADEFKEYLRKRYKYIILTGGIFTAVYCGVSLINKTLFSLQSIIYGIIVCACGSLITILYFYIILLIKKEGYE